MNDTVTRFFDTLYGNEQIKEYFASVIVNNILSHAYVIEGPVGSGRHTLAVSIACALSPMAARKIRDGNCPDVSVISHEENRKTIGIETIRSLKESASLAANELDIKVFIIEDADTMTTQAQNAFLKLLEEPPRDTYMLLLCGSSQGLLPTVLSRAPLIRMQIFSDDELDRYLSANDKKAAELSKKDADAYYFAIRSAAGCIGAAKKRLSPRSSSGDIELYDKTRRYITLFSTFDKAEFYIFSNTLAAKREELADFFEVLECALRDLIYVKRMTMTENTDSTAFMFYHDYEEAAETASHFTSEALRHLMTTVTETHESLDSNVNLKTTLIIFAGKMWSGAHK
jgi:DNA polymerase-3 subunit delta'